MKWNLSVFHKDSQKAEKISAFDDSKTRHVLFLRNGFKLVANIDKRRLNLTFCANILLTHFSIQKYE